MTLTQADEERTLKKFERACYKAAHNSDIHGYAFRDLVQEARLAALEAIRLFDPTRGNCSLSSFVIDRIKWKMRNLNRIHNYKEERQGGGYGKRGLSARVRAADCLSLDYKKEDRTFGDVIEGPHRADANLFLLACESLCQSAIEREILVAIADGVKLAEVGRRHRVTRSRIWQIKEALAERIRANISI